MCNEMEQNREVCLLCHLRWSELSSKSTVALSFASEGITIRNSLRPQEQEPWRSCIAPIAAQRDNANGTEGARGTML